MSSSVQRFLGRRDRRSKVFLPFSHFHLPSPPWRKDADPGASPLPDQRRSRSIDSSLDLADHVSNRPSKKRPTSVQFTPSPTIATPADRDCSLALQTPPDTGAFGGLFVPEERKKLEKEDEKRMRTQIKTIIARLQTYGITTFTEANVNYALQATNSEGNGEDAMRLLLLFEDTYEGILKTYNPSTKLLGAENRNGVTCYLDALLFTMFARLDSFEAMLYNSFEDLPRKKLAGLLRLWVNMLRSGRLITRDITKNLQDSLAECGWESAAELCQQDTSEAFTFITGKLELPLLTLKMDLFHTGKEDPADDHKFVNERLLEVAVVTEPPEGSSVVTLEDCLENYFNNRIEVKRHLDRRNTLQSVRSNERLQRSNSCEKGGALHVETVEYFDQAATPRPDPSTPVKSPSSAPGTPIKSPLDKIRPGMNRKRADSIFSQRRVMEAKPDEKKELDDATNTPGRPRKNSIRTEVLMPAWQFFKLLPWYTENIIPTSDAQVAAHFSKKRPVLGIALKRYQYTNTGIASRLDTFIDIPLEIAVPNFVSDDEMEDHSPLVGNFKLVLQSVVCHRGVSVNSGHYVSLVRGRAANAQSIDGRSDRPDTATSVEEEDPWMLFDDLARERVTYVDINQKLKEECPYLLFYQVQPIDEELIPDAPPTYDEAMSRHPSDSFEYSPEKLKKIGSDENDMVLVESSSPTSPNGLSGTETADWTASNRTSLDIRGRASLDARRESVADDGSAAGSQATMSVPSTPIDESRGSFLGIPSRRGSKVSTKKTKSRPGSTDGGSRFSLNMSMSKLTSRVSRTDLTNLAAAAEQDEDQVHSKDVEGQPTVSGSEASVESLKNLDAKMAEKAEKERTGRSKVRKERSEKGHEGHFHRKRKTEKPDRECTIM
ncbi:cysteine proteinase [Aureobasidium pullulans]|nr:cysteine proteinase [Aureobasidium pullulans]